MSPELDTVTDGRRRRGIADSIHVDHRQVNLGCRHTRVAVRLLADRTDRRHGRALCCCMRAVLHAVCSGSALFGVSGQRCIQPVGASAGLDPWASGLLPALPASACSPRRSRIESSDFSPQYRSLAIMASGNDLAGDAVEIVMSLHCFGTATSYLIVIGDLCPQLAAFAGGTGVWVDRQTWITCIGVGVALPLFWQRRLDSLRHFSALGNLSIIIVAAVTVAFALRWLQPNSGEGYRPVGLLPPASGEASLAGQFESLSIYIFAFACAMNLPTIVLELCEPTPARVYSVIVIGILVASSLYMVVALAGCGAFGGRVAPNLLTSFPIGTDADRFHATAYIAVVARVCVVVTVTTSFPLLMHPSRNSAAQLILGRHAVELDALPWALLSSAMFALSWIVAMLVRSLDDTMGYLGASTGMCIGFIFPAAFYYLAPPAAEDDLDAGAADAAATLPSVHQTRYRLMGRDDGTTDGTPPLGVPPGRVRRDYMRDSALCVAIGSTALVPVLLGAQTLKVLQA